MKIYVSGPSFSDLQKGTNNATIYNAIMEKLGKEHEVVLPFRTPELDKLDAKDFFAAMSQKILAAEGVITVIESGDQSTPVEATIASFNGKPQYVLEIAGLPRMVRGLPGVVGVARFSLHQLEGQLDEALRKLIEASLERRKAA